MIKCFLTVLLSAYCCGLLSQDYIDQRYGRQRVVMGDLGFGCWDGDTNNLIEKTGVLFDFNSDTLKMSVVDTFVSEMTPVKFYQYTNNAQICNKEGQLTAFFNGAELWDRYGNKEFIKIFQDADSDVPGIYWFNRSIILPFPGKDSTYFLFTPNKHKYDPVYQVKTANSISGLIFREETNGRLKILEEIPDILTGNFTAFGTVSAVRHANGRDWWVVAPERLSSTLHSFLLTPQGISSIKEQDVGDTIIDLSYAPEFSPDGQWYTRTHIRSISMYQKVNTVQLIKFDRCSGLFEKPVQFDLEYEDTSAVAQVIFEKNSRYFYIMNTLTVYQGDIYSEDIKGSLIRVARYHFNDSDPSKHLLFGCSFLGPDDRIYIFDGRYQFETSVINNPSERGSACDFVYEGIKKPACTGMSLGNMPNFSLGPIDGSSCDTLGLDNPLSTEVFNQNRGYKIKIFPNPSKDILYGDVTLSDQKRQVLIYSANGSLAYRGTGGNLVEGIDISHLASGIYVVLMEGLPIGKMLKVE